MFVHKYVDRNGSAAMPKPGGQQVSHQRWIWDFGFPMKKSDVLQNFFKKELKTPTSGD